MLPELTHTFSALQAFGRKLGLTGPRDGSPPASGRQGLPGAVPPHPLLDGSVENAPQPPGGSPGERANAGMSATVYGLRADLKTVKAPDQVLGHSLNTLV
jgi:hypothetical protein